MRKRILTAAITFVVPCCTNSTSVQPRPVPARITILGPDPIYADINTYERVLAHVYDSSGALLDDKVRVAWSSRDTSVVLVDQMGSLTFRRLGISVIQATVDTNGTHVKDSVEVHAIMSRPLDRVGSSLRP